MFEQYKNIFTSSKSNIDSLVDLICSTLGTDNSGEIKLILKNKHNIGLINPNQIKDLLGNLEKADTDLVSFKHRTDNYDNMLNQLAKLQIFTLIEQIITPNVDCTKPLQELINLIGDKIHAVNKITMAKLHDKPLSPEDLNFPDVPKQPVGETLDPPPPTWEPGKGPKASSDEESKNRGPTLGLPSFLLQPKPEPDEEMPPLEDISDASPDASPSAVPSAVPSPVMDFTNLKQEATDNQNKLKSNISLHLSGSVASSAPNASSALTTTVPFAAPHPTTTVPPVPSASFASGMQLGPPVPPPSSNSSGSPSSNSSGSPSSDSSGSPPSSDSSGSPPSSNSPSPFPPSSSGSPPVSPSPLPSSNSSPSSSGSFFHSFPLGPSSNDSSSGSFLSQIRNPNIKLKKHEQRQESEKFKEHKKKQDAAAAAHLPKQLSNRRKLLQDEKKGEDEDESWDKKYLSMAGGYDITTYKNKYLKYKSKYLQLKKSISKYL